MLINVCVFQRKKATSIEPQSQCNCTLYTRETDTLRTKPQCPERTTQNNEMRSESSILFPFPSRMNAGKGLATLYTHELAGADFTY